jgi:hypothetical protein
VNVTFCGGAAIDSACGSVVKSAADGEAQAAKHSVNRTAKHVRMVFFMVNPFFCACALRDPDYGAVVAKTGIRPASGKTLQ